MTTPREHAPAVVIGLLPGLAAWAAILMKSALRAGRVALNQPNATYAIDPLSDLRGVLATRTAVAPQ